MLIHPLQDAVHGPLQLWHWRGVQALLLAVVSREVGDSACGLLLLQRRHAVQVLLLADPSREGAPRLQPHLSALRCILRLWRWCCVQLLLLAGPSQERALRLQELSYAPLRRARSARWAATAAPGQPGALSPALGRLGSPGTRPAQEVYLQGLTRNSSSPSSKEGSLAVILPEQVQSEAILAHHLDPLLRDDVVAVSLRQVGAVHQLHAAPLRLQPQLPLPRHLCDRAPLLRAINTPLPPSLYSVSSCRSWPLAFNRAQTHDLNSHLSSCQ